MAQKNLKRYWKGSDKPTSKRSTGHFPTQKSLPKLEKELDEVFSLYIRFKYMNDSGVIKCFTCSFLGGWKQIQNGHYHSRRYKSVRWDELNCHPQCVGCNIFHEGKKPAYTLAMIRKYGEGILETLDIKKNNRSTIGRFEMGFLIQEYTEKLKALPTYQRFGQTR